MVNRNSIFHTTTTDNYICYYSRAIFSVIRKIRLLINTTKMQFSLFCQYSYFLFRSIKPVKQHTSALREHLELGGIIQTKKAINPN